MPGRRPDQREDRPIVRIDAAAAGPAGLRAVELLCREGLVLRRLDCRIELTGASPALRRVLDVAGLGAVLPCADDGEGPGHEAGPRSEPPIRGPSGVEAEG